MAGLFLSIDGIDGCGKSTQMELLQQWLAEQGQELIRVREPGGTRLGESLREILLHKAEIPLVATSEMLMYMASRAQLVEEIIRPALAVGKTVLSDRYLLANIVYQGYGGGLEPKRIWSVGEIATGGLAPSHTFILDIEPEQALARLSSEKDRLESRGLEYMTRVREGYLKEAPKLGEAHSILDATQSIDSLQSEIRQTVGKLLFD
ncbi:MAG: dTMP kinase [Planctomycetota bacterium]